jgi:hypothetical protein
MHFQPTWPKAASGACFSVIWKTGPNASRSLQRWPERKRKPSQARARRGELSDALDHAHQIPRAG